MKIVAIGPMLATIDILEEPIKRIPFVIKNEGSTVEIIAIQMPNQYTCFGKLKIENPCKTAKWIKTAMHEIY